MEELLFAYSLSALLGRQATDQLAEPAQSWVRRSPSRNLGFATQIPAEQHTACVFGLGLRRQVPYPPSSRVSSFRLAGSAVADKFQATLPGSALLAREPPQSQDRGTDQARQGAELHPSCHRRASLVLPTYRC